MPHVWVENEEVLSPDEFERRKVIRSGTISETTFLQDMKRLYSLFEKRRPDYVGDNYKSLIFKGEISYSNFIKIHNFKAQIPLPLPSCDCIFRELSDALKETTVKEKLLAMKNIRGLRLPMASAVLHFSDPENYPIIDENVIKGMKKLGWRTRVTMEINKGTADFYEYYIDKVRNLRSKGKIVDISKKFDVTPIRLIEAALYSLGKNWKSYIKESTSANKT